MSETDPKTKNIQKNSTSIFFQKPALILILVLVFSVIIGFVSFSRANNPNSQSSQNNTLTQNIQSSTSNSSISSSSSIFSSSVTTSSSNISTSQAASSSAAPVSSVAQKPESNLAVYTNQFLPKLKIVYDKSWSFSTTTSKSNYPELINRKITLTKGNSVLSFFTGPIGPSDCVGNPDADYKVISSSKLPSGQYKNVFQINNAYLQDEIQKLGVDYVSFGKTKYSFFCSMEDMTPSNISASDVPNYTLDQFGSNVIYKVIVGDRGLRADDPLINEMTDIISQSTFW